MNFINKKIVFVFSLVLFVIVNSCSGQVPDQKIHWMSIEEAQKQSAKEPKKVFVDVYTHWCGWCKRMDASTFMIDSIADYMNKNYYAVKFDAETKDSIKFKDKVFAFRPEYKSNELAVSLLNGQMSYPSFVFLDEGFNMLSPLVGYQTPEQISPVLKFFGENIFKTKTWEQYMNIPVEGKAK